MERTIPLTRFAEHHAQAKAIQRRLDNGAAETAALRQVLKDPIELAVQTLAEANDAFEGLAAVVMILYPEVQGAYQRRWVLSRRP